MRNTISEKRLSGLAKFVLNGDNVELNDVDEFLDILVTQNGRLHRKEVVTLILINGFEQRFQNIKSYFRLVQYVVSFFR